MSRSGGVGSPHSDGDEDGELGSCGGLWASGTGAPGLRGFRTAPGRY
uniref:Uncharacterized protein n=1 Tax=Arundo donax TaxID=35708 RepID=A0A0A8XX06_ARUDO